jgi:putative transposase
MAGRRRSDRALRGKLRSPGRPPVARQGHRRRFWALVAEGLSSEDAAMEVGVSQPVGFRWFREAGGMAPSHLSRSSEPLSGRYLTYTEREEIALWRAQDFGVREIARRLGRAPSTISRELRRNAATRGGDLDYRAATAQWHAERAARRPKAAKLATDPELRSYVQERLAGGVVAPGGAAVPGPSVPWRGRRHGRRRDRRWGTAWSPQQIAERLRLDHPDDTRMRISHEAIYQALYVQVLPRYARRTRRLEALIAGAYLAGTNARRVQRALAALFRGAVGKDVVSRAWRKVKADWEAWCRRDLGGEDVVRLVLDGTVVRARLDRKATAISLLVVLGIRRDGQKVLLAVRAMGGEGEAAWRAVLDDLTARGLKTPEFLIAGGAAGLEKALAALWPAVPAQRCTVHKHRNLLAHAPERLHEEVSADYTDMIYAASAKEVEAKSKTFLRKWRLKCRAVADSLEEAGGRLFAFTRLHPGQWRSARTTNAVERLHEEFKRRIRTQAALPSAETAAMLFWALLASGQVAMRKVDGWQSLGQPIAGSAIDLAA